MCLGIVRFGKVNDEMHFNTIEELAEATRADYIISLNTGQVLKDRRGEKMVNADEYYGNYLKGEDITTDFSVKIKSVKPETIEDEDKIVVHFHELKKALVLNKTNKDRIKEIAGSSETENWTGLVITLTTEMASFGGKDPKPAVRVKPKQPAQGNIQKSDSQSILDKVASAV